MCERTGTVGVTYIYSGVASAEGKRFVEPRRLAKEFFFTRKREKVCAICLIMDNKQIYNSLIHRVKRT